MAAASVSSSSYSWDRCLMDIRLCNTTLDSIHLEDDTTISESVIDRISSAADLVLDHCQLQGQVAARNLFLDNCIYANIFQQAIAEEGVWVKIDKCAKDGLVHLPFVVAKSGSVHYQLPPDIDWAMYSNICCQALTIPDGVERVYLSNSHVSGDIAFANSAASELNFVVIQGTTYFRGKVIGGTLIDDRDDAK